MSPETPHPPLVAAPFARIIVVDKVSILVDCKICEVHELVMKLVRSCRIRLSGEPEMYNVYSIQVQSSPDKTIAIKVDSKRIKSGDEDVEPHVKLVISDQERVVNVLLYYCWSLHVLKLVYIPVANIFDLDSMAVV